MTGVLPPVPRRGCFLADGNTEDNVDEADDFDLNLDFGLAIERELLKCRSRSGRKRKSRRDRSSKRSKRKKETHSVGQVFLDASDVSRAVVVLNGGDLVVANADDLALIDVDGCDAPVPDIGQTEHANIFLQNYFNPPERLRFSFHEDFENQEDSEDSDDGVYVEEEEGDDPSSPQLPVETADKCTSTDDAYESDSDDSVVFIAEVKKSSSAGDESTLAARLCSLQLANAAHTNKMAIPPPQPSIVYGAHSQPDENCSDRSSSRSSSGSSSNGSSRHRASASLHCGESRLDRIRRLRHEQRHRRRLRLQKEQQRQRLRGGQDIRGGGS